MGTREKYKQKAKAKIYDGAEGDYNTVLPCLNNLLCAFGVLSELSASVTHILGFP